MAIALYIKMYNQMIEENKDIFEEFRELDKAFEEKKDDVEYRKKFNLIGEKVLEIIRRYEGVLCSRTESSSKSIYSSGLSEKFWQLLRKNFPNIDEVGIS